MFDSEVDAVDLDDHEWAKRSEFWLKQRLASSKPRGRRERRKEPLILCGHGVTLRIEDGALVIRDGFTHYPQPVETCRYFKGDLALPQRIVMVDGSGTISFDVLTWLGAQDVAFVLLNWAGEVLSVFGGNGYSADRKKVAWQEATRADPDKRLAFATDLVRRKLAASVVALETALPSSKSQEAAVAKARAALDRLIERPPSDLAALRLTEAVCASAYFGAWRHLDLRWKATARRPIPDDWRRFTSRTSLANNSKLLNINASHPVNAMLNYAYGALETIMRIQAVADGFDPTIGIMHHSRRAKSAFVFDLMEPERPKVDAALLRFVGEHALSASDFAITDSGVCRLSPQLARAVCQIASSVGTERSIPLA
jgi:CRISPR-associated protein Cas1